jgi:uncharacterized protein (TIGR03118 family)
MQRSFRHTLVLTISVGLVLMFVSSAALAQYKLTNLVSNQKGKAKHTDPNLVNAWGLTFAPSGPFFVTDTGTGLATVYTGKGVPQKTVVTVPPASGTGTGSPTGIVYNGSQEFQVGGAAAMFLFSTLDGTISGWSPANGTQAIITVNNSGAHSSYNGLGITSNASGNFLYAPDFTNNRVDIYDGNFKFVASLADPHVPAGFVPFNVQDIGGRVYVAYANMNTSKAGGFIDIFEEDGTLARRFTHGKPLNQPWGFALAPKNFGPLSNTLLISNNVTNNGTINGFDLKTGKFVGTIKNVAGKQIKIDQLWGIKFGGGTSANGKKNQLFFAAGPNNNLDGTFGVIEFK